jgi:hypothetical protein
MQYCRINMIIPKKNGNKYIQNMPSHSGKTLYGTHGKGCRRTAMQNACQGTFIYGIYLVTIRNRGESLLARLPGQVLVYSMKAATGASRAASAGQRQRTRA